MPQNLNNPSGVSPDAPAGATATGGTLPFRRAALAAEALAHALAPLALVDEGAPVGASVVLRWGDGEQYEAAVVRRKVAQ